MEYFYYLSNTANTQSHFVCHKEKKQILVFNPSNLKTVLNYFAGC